MIENTGKGGCLSPLHRRGETAGKGDRMETRPYVAWELMSAFIIDVFKAYGVPEADARICADVLLESDRRGIESHGCNRFKPIYIDRIENGTLLPVTKVTDLRDGRRRHPEFDPFRHRRLLD